MYRRRWHCYNLRVAHRKFQRRKHASFQTEFQHIKINNLAQIYIKNSIRAYGPYEYLNNNHLYGNEYINFLHLIEIKRYK